MPDTNIVSFAPHPAYAERARLFHDKYDLIEIISTESPKFSKSQFKKRPNRVCRFCKKTMPEVTFKNDAHLVSRFLNNKTLFSDFECDKCNNKFGHMESDLASFIGISRSIAGLSEDQLPPGLVS